MIIGSEINEVCICAAELTGMFSSHKESTTQFQIPQGLKQSDEEDALYEEVEDTRRQHSQFTT